MQIPHRWNVVNEILFQWKKSSFYCLGQWSLASVVWYSIYEALVKPADTRERPLYLKFLSIRDLTLPAFGSLLLFTPYKKKHVRSTYSSFFPKIYDCYWTLQTIKKESFSETVANILNWTLQMCDISAELLCPLRRSFLCKEERVLAMEQGVDDYTRICIKTRKAAESA